MSRCWVHVSCPRRRAQRFAGPIDAARLIARRQYRCRSCSQVKPMAPNIVSASSTRSGTGEIAITAAPAAAMRCWSSGSSAARTASQAAAVASSLLTNSIAALCCNAWKVPITLPNCSRMRRCAVTASTHHCAMPAIMLASRPSVTHRARSGSMPVSTADRPRGSRRAARCRRRRPGRCRSTGSAVAVGFSVSTTTQTTSSSSARAPTRTVRAAHTPAVTSRRAGDQPSPVVGARAEVAVVGKHDCRGHARRPGRARALRRPASHRPAGRRLPPRPSAAAARATAPCPPLPARMRRRSAGRPARLGFPADAPRENRCRPGHPTSPAARPAARSSKLSRVAAMGACRPANCPTASLSSCCSGLSPRVTMTAER